jgi:hypothetical protein
MKACGANQAELQGAAAIAAAVGSSRLACRRDKAQQERPHLAAEARDDHAHGILRIHAALLEVEQLVLPDLAGAGLVLDSRAGLPHLNKGGGREGGAAAKHGFKALAAWATHGCCMMLGCWDSVTAAAQL